MTPHLICYIFNCPRPAPPSPTPAKSQRQAVTVAVTLPPATAPTKTSGSDEAATAAFLKEARSSGSFFSYHRCVGWDYTETAWKRRTCHLKNVCYLRDTGQWHYLNRHGSAVRLGDLSVSLSPLGRTGDGGSSGKQLNFVVLPATNSTAASYLRLPQRNGLHIMYESYNAENFGHFVGDELLPLYQAADLFGFADQLNDIQVVRSDVPGAIPPPV